MERASARPRHVALGLQVGALVLLAACGGPGSGSRETERDASPIRNVLLVSIDTCRADRLGCYGGRADTTPNIDAVAREGTRFGNVVTPVPATLPAHGSMLTGTIPPFHGAHDNGEVFADEPNVTLAEVLRQRGFSTAAVVGAFVLDSRFGLDHGFDTYDDRFEDRIEAKRIEQRRGEEVSRHAVTWLEEHHDQPFFLFLHYFDPHMLYDPPEPFRSRFADDPYAGEIAYVDHCIGVVLERMKSLGVYDSTLIVITADHGEMLGEHGERTHSYFVYRNAVRVPMIVRVPGRSTPQVVDDLVGVIDIAPTVYGLLGVEPPGDLDGSDLSPVLGGGEPSMGRRVLYSESIEATKYGCNPLLAVIDPDWKYIDTTRPELYDLRADPGEAINLVDEHPDVADEMRDRLAGIVARRRRDAEAAATLDSETRAKLQSLGYVGGGSSRDDLAVEPDRPDPKDVIAFHDLNMGVPYLLVQGDYAAAREVAETMVAQRPDYHGGHVHLGKIALAGNRPSEAAAHLGRAAELRPDDAEVQVEMGRALLEAGDLKQAIVRFRMALELEDDNAGAQNNLGLALARQGDRQGAAEHYRRALEIDPENAEALGNLANLHSALGQPDEAQALYRRALEADPSSVVLHRNFGAFLTRQGRPADAAAHYRQSLKTLPEAAELHAALASTSIALRDIEEVVAHYRLAVELRPGVAEWHNNLGSALQLVEQRQEALRHFREAVRLAPGYTKAHLNLGLALLLDNHLDEAIEHLRKAVELEPGHAKARQQLDAALSARASQESGGR